jgi:hypothetical protein
LNKKLRGKLSALCRGIPSGTIDNAIIQQKMAFVKSRFTQVARRSMWWVRGASYDVRGQALQGQKAGKLASFPAFQTSNLAIDVSISF